MNITELIKTSRSVSFQLDDGGIYNTKQKYTLQVTGGGKTVKQETERVVTSIYGLSPDTEYRLACLGADGKVAAVLNFRTNYEFVTLNVRDFGARGDGIQDDTAFIQAAVMCCPEHGRVLIPGGTYKISTIFLKSHLRLELLKDAVLAADADRYVHPVLPGLIESYDETSEYNLGSWEGNPLPMFAGIITGVNVTDVIIYGEGTVNGNASRENWWKDAKKMVGAFRPRLLFLNACKNVSIQGVTFKNSPSWTLHPYFSEDLGFYDMVVENPADSPNTDGLDPESCRNVVIKGNRFSLGDDCIAVKSGKIYMGRKHKIPSEHITISQCLMEYGHGAVTIGSEMAGGVKNLRVDNCRFRHTDRGLRVKTRRGRGEDAVLDQISFENIVMDHVKTPLVVNSFYHCDPDGGSEYVRTRDVLPVDERTPRIGRLSFKNMSCTNCHVCAGFFYGLPERKIDELKLENIAISFAEDARPDVPAMLADVKKCSRKGFDIGNVIRLICRNVTIAGSQGETFVLDNVNEKIIE